MDRGNEASIDRSKRSQKKKEARLVDVIKGLCCSSSPLACRKTRHMYSTYLSLLDLEISATLATRSLLQPAGTLVSNALVRIG